MAYGPTDLATRELFIKEEEALARAEESIDFQLARMNLRYVAGKCDAGTDPIFSLNISGPISFRTAVELSSRYLAKGWKNVYVTVADLDENSTITFRFNRSDAFPTASS